MVCAKDLDWLHTWEKFALPDALCWINWMNAQSYDLIAQTLESNFMIKKDQV